jgi:hypothetical protein
MQQWNCVQKMSRSRARIHAVVHWQGGDHTELQVKQRLNAAGCL